MEANNTVQTKTPHETEQFFKFVNAISPQDSYAGCQLHSTLVAEINKRWSAGDHRGAEEVLALFQELDEISLECSSEGALENLSIYLSDASTELFCDILKKLVKEVNDYEVANQIKHGYDFYAAFIEETLSVLAKRTSKAVTLPSS
jgi:hypothetical protein